MKFTILFDLDDTLLANQTEQFLPAYLNALGSHLSPVIDPKRMVGQLLSATDAMVKNLRPDRTLEQVFDASFYSPLGLQKSEVIDRIDDFYQNYFPTLRSVTRPRPKAIRLVKELLQDGQRVVIATNPLFPQTAINQRLEWAGLSPEENQFAIIPGFEHFHFAKPNPAYYTELLARLGYPTDPIIMVGNDPENDIIPARQVGILPFFLHDDNLPVPAEAAAHGDFDDLKEWLDNFPTVEPEEFPPITHIRAILSATPAVLLHQQISPNRWKMRQNELSWSPVELVCHLRDIEVEINLPRVKRFVQEEAPALQTIDTDTWADQRDYQSQDGEVALAQFLSARLALLDHLAQLPHEVWQKKADHTSYGEITLQELLILIAEHDIEHVQEIIPLTN